jgi:hypothetical protein
MCLLELIEHASSSDNRELLAGERRDCARGFANTMGDPVFDGTLRQGMSVQLEQSPFLSLISDERIPRALEQMGLPAATRLTRRSRGKSPRAPRAPQIQVSSVLLLQSLPPHPGKLDSIASVTAL